MLKKLIKSKRILKGVVEGYVENPDDVNKDEVIVKWEDLQVHVLRGELDIVPYKKSLSTWVGHGRNFVLTSYNLETGIIYGSFKEYKEIKKAEVLKEMKDDGKEVEALITRIFDWGAYLVYNKTTLVLFNNKWSEDYATIKEYHKCGDTILVKFFRDAGDYIHVEAVNKYKEPKIQDISFLKPRDVIIGRVRTVRLDRIYVKVASGLDVLCSIPSEEWYNPEPMVGDLVAVRLTQVHPEEIRMRGKIQGHLEGEEIENKAGNLDNITFITIDEFKKCCSTDPDFVFGDIEKMSRNSDKYLRNKGGR